LKKGILNLTVVILALCFSAQAPAQSKRTFTFSHTPNLFSEGWDVVLDGGEISIKQRDYEVKDYGKFSLTEAESAEIWKLIQAEEFKGLKFSDKQRGDCDTQYMFTLKDESGSYSISIDTPKAHSKQAVMAVVNRIAELIKKYAGVEPKIY
jgi:hypothetical protein